MPCKTCPKNFHVLSWGHLSDKGVPSTERCLLLLCAVWLTLLVFERARARRDRARLEHVVHVNGTRGKSTVTRLIAAGLRAGGWRTACKTTGTDPIYSGVDGSERPIRRIAPSNIREQLRILHRAAGEGAQILVVECMAVQPELQRVSQQEMLRGDIGVITNVRLDHTDVMGATLPEIAVSLCSTVPDRGALFTAEDRLTQQLAEAAQARQCRFFPVRPDGSEPDFDFAENIALALAVCAHLGVPRETALEGMRHFSRDPYALSLWRIGSGVFVNALSINDPESTARVYADVRGRLEQDITHTVFLFNNRMDRGARTHDMVSVALRLKPDEVWLLGSGQDYFRRSLLLDGFSGTIVPLGRQFESRLRALPAGTLVFAAGNIANDGRRLMEFAAKEGSPLV